MSTMTLDIMSDRISLAFMQSSLRGFLRLGLPQTGWLCILGPICSDGLLRGTATTTAALDPRERRQQAGDVAAAAEDRAAALGVGQVVGAHHVEIAQVGASEAQARDRARRNIDARVGLPVGQEALHRAGLVEGDPDPALGVDRQPVGPALHTDRCQDRKSTRLNSSHLGISYAVFCL